MSVLQCGFIPTSGGGGGASGSLQGEKKSDLGKTVSQALNVVDSASNGSRNDSNIFTEFYDRARSDQPFVIFLFGLFVIIMFIVTILLYSK